MILPPTLVDEYTFGLIYEVLEQLPDNAKIVELGSFLGGSIVRIRKKLSELDKIGNIFAIDNWKCMNISQESKDWVGVHNNFEDKTKENIIKAGWETDIQLINSDTLTACQLFQDNSIDLLFVDDDHSYPHTKYILEKWLEKVKHGGYIIGHDFSDNGVAMAVKEVLNDDIVFCETRSGYRYKKC
jgi:hypothetical protein